MSETCGTCGLWFTTCGLARQCQTRPGPHTAMDPACEAWSGSLVAEGDTPTERRDNLRKRMVNLRQSLREQTMQGQAMVVDWRLVRGQILVLCRTIEILVDELEQMDELLHVYKEASHG